IADEPTSALDVTSQRAVLDLLRRLLEEGIIQSVVFITHELPLLQQVADRIAVMYAGRLVETGRVKEVLARPQHPYTQALVRSVLAPEPRRGRARVEGIPGAPPDLRELPQGCAFAPRCGVALDRCRVEVPPRFRSGDRDAWCWRLLEEGWMPATVAGMRGSPPGDGRGHARGPGRPGGVRTGLGAAGGRVGESRAGGRGAEASWTQAGRAKEGWSWGVQRLDGSSWRPGT